MLNFFRKKENAPAQITISNKSVIRVILIVLAAYLLLIAVRKSQHSLILIFTAFFLSLAFNAPVHWISEHLPGKRRGSRALATTISFLVVVILLIAFVASILPPLIRQTNTFIKAAPSLVQQVHEQNSGLGNFVRRYHLEKQVNELSSQLGSRLGRLGGNAFSTVTRITTSFFSVLVIFVLTFMMLIEGPRWINFFHKQLPEEYQDHAESLSRKMYGVIKGYVNGQVLMAAIASVIIVIPLFVLNVSYPIALMVVVFICALIPLIGHSIGAVIVSIVALFHSPWAALFILAYYILYMQVEAYVIQPRIQSNSTNLSPLLVIVAIIIGVSFDGLLGGLVAIPIMGCLRVLVLDYISTNHGLFGGKPT